MTALAQYRNTKRLAEDGEGPALMNLPINGGDKLYQGSIGVLNSEGNLTKGVTGTGLVAIGRIEWNYDASSVLDGALRGEVRPGVFNWANSTSGDLIDSSMVGKPCWIVDDQTVAATSATNTRSPAGIIHRVDSEGVWVKMSIEISRTLLNDSSADGT